MKIDGVTCPESSEKKKKALIHQGLWESTLDLGFQSIKK